MMRDPLVRAMLAAVALSASSLAGPEPHAPTARRQRSSDDPILLADARSKLTASIRLIDGAGGAVRYRQTKSGTEDFVTFAQKPETEAVRYRVDVSRVAGLRLVDNVLEFLDVGGVPRLRMAAPFITDRTGTRVDAAVSVPDCDVDRDPAAPWGRTVTAAGHAACTVAVTWISSPVKYPAVLDPAWAATTNMMTAPRSGHTATLLPNGRVLLVGGETTTGGTTVHLKSAELFDPTTNTFAATTPMTDARSLHVAVGLPNGNVLVAGGNGDAGPLASTELYDLSKPGFRTVGPLLTARAQAQAVLLDTAEVLIAGGIDKTPKTLDSAELWDGTSEAWKVTDSMQSARVGYFLTNVPQTGAFAIAGITTATGIGTIAASQVFQTSTHSWAPAPSLGTIRFDFAGAVLVGQKILVAGGFGGALGANLDTAEIYDPNAGAWAPSGTLSLPRAQLTLTALANGAAVAAGGAVMKDATTIESYAKSVDLYDATAKTWSKLADLSEARAAHTATLLTDGRLLVAGGTAGAAALQTAELFSLDAPGAACTTSATCGSGFCVDGVCCSTACAGTCNACAHSATGKPDGTCGVVQKGLDPRNDCKDDGAPSCQKNGLCDGAGACGTYAGTSCTPSPCATDADCTSGACADGICCDTACNGTCEACTSAKKGTSGDGTCGPIANATDPDAECGTLGTGTCRSTATCDGSRACRVSTVGNACSAVKCSDGETLSAATTCSAVGDCTPVTTSCAPFGCDAATAACKTTCKADSDCSKGAHCSGGVCEKNANGAACTSAVECTSGFCADGVCCDQACDGQCEACATDGNVGTCTATTGTPAGTRPACAGTSPCGGTCNGLERTACVYPNIDVACGAGPTCANGAESASHCNGLGACADDNATSCAPYGCDSTACKTSCKKDADCAAGATCDGVGECTTGPGCAGKAAVGLADGGSRSCGAFQCSAGECESTCTTTADCATGATCDKSTQRCTTPSKDSGCGCRLVAASTAPRGGVMLAFLAVVPWFARRRRRSGRARSRA
jgi:hypothetical protein